MSAAFDYQQGWAAHANGQSLPVAATDDFVKGWLLRREYRQLIWAMSGIGRLLWRGRDGNLPQDQPQ